MATTYVVYGDTSDYFNTSFASTWAAARNGTGSVVASSTTGVNIDARLRFSSPNYFVDQGYIGFDCSSVPSGTDSAVAIILTVVQVSGSPTTKTIEIREHSWTSGGGSANFVAGSSLSGKTLFGSASYSTVGAKTFSGSGPVPRGLAKYVVHDERQRTDVASAGTEAHQFRSADQGGTTDDPRITFDVTPGGKPKVWTGSAWTEKPVKVWTGSAWTEKPMKYWTGSSWELV